MARRAWALSFMPSTGGGSYKARQRRGFATSSPPAAVEGRPLSPNASPQLPSSTVARPSGGRAKVLRGLHLPSLAECLLAAAFPSSCLCTGLLPKAEHPAPPRLAISYCRHTGYSTKTAIFAALSFVLSPGEALDLSVSRVCLRHPDTLTAFEIPPTSCGCLVVSIIH